MFFTFENSNTESSKTSMFRNKNYVGFYSILSLHSSMWLFSASDSDSESDFEVKKKLHGAKMLR